MIRYYREFKGDYLAVDFSPEHICPQKDHDGSMIREGRATAISGVSSSVCTTGISERFLKTECQRVPKRMVPKEWIKAIGL